MAYFKTLASGTLNNKLGFEELHGPKLSESLSPFMLSFLICVLGPVLKKTPQSDVAKSPVPPMSSKLIFEKRPFTSQEAHVQAWAYEKLCDRRNKARTSDNHYLGRGHTSQVPLLAGKKPKEHCSFKQGYTQA